MTISLPEPSALPRNLSLNPHLIAKVCDMVGFRFKYPGAACPRPEQRAVVLCVADKNKLQEPDRTVTGWPMWPGMARRQTHEHLLQGATKLDEIKNLRVDFHTGSVALTGRINASPEELCLSSLDDPAVLR